MDHGRLLTLDEVSEMTGISKSQLRWLRQTGRGPRMGLVSGRVRAKESDVEAWIESEIASTATGGTAA